MQLEESTHPLLFSAGDLDAFQEEKKEEKNPSLFWMTHIPNSHKGERRPWNINGSIVAR